MRKLSLSSPNVACKIGEYFDVCCPWSISLGTEVSIDDVSVKLVRRADGATWNFSRSSADGFFNVENSYYGQQGCIIFRPDFSTVSGYEHDDIYDVTITGAPSGEISYSVHFFELVHKHNYKNSKSYICNFRHI